jgi:hypothetical protein
MIIYIYVYREKERERVREAIAGYHCVLKVFGMSE